MTLSSENLAQNILQILPLMMSAASAGMRRTGYTLSPGHMGILSVLSQRSCTLTELADALAVSLPSMSNSVATLADRGWVVRRQSAEDRRRLSIALAPAGEAVLADMVGQMTTELSAAIEPLDDGQRHTLLAGVAVLRKVYLRIEQGDKMLAWQETLK